MSDNSDPFTDSIDRILRSPEAAMLDDNMYADLEDFCVNARSAAESGDLQEAHRLLSLAKEFLFEEDSISGTE